MLSYRHAFHAGNHADVLKHLVLIELLDYYGRKDKPWYYIDTHAGGGCYALDSEQAGKTAEAADGIGRLWGHEDLPPTVATYVEAVRQFNPQGRLLFYPGSPALAMTRARAHDRLRLFELHPADFESLDKNVAELPNAGQIQVVRNNGFEGLKALLPPPTRRGLVLIDPSYEIKSDYAKVAAAVQDALKRFATGVYLVWYPIIGRPEAHGLPRRLKTLAQQAGKPWLHATLTVKSSKLASPAAGEGARRPGLSASGMFVVNPPFTLQGVLREALPQMAQLLAQDRNASHTLEVG